MFGSRDQWLRHEKSHLQDEEIEMECPFCREGFKQDDPDNDRYRHIRRDMESIRLLAVPRPAMFPDNDTFIASSACSVASDRTNQISNQTNDLLTKTQLFPASDVSATDKDVERGCRHFHPCMESIGLLSLPPPPLNSEEDDDKLEQCSCDSNNIEPLNSQPGSNFRKQPADGFETQLKALPNLTEFNQTIDRWFSLMHNSSEPTDTSDKGEEVKRVDNTDWYQTDLDFTDDDHGYDVDNGIGLESPNLSKPKNEFWDEE
jgi:hypothetical protein